MVCNELLLMFQRYELHDASACSKIKYGNNLPEFLRWDDLQKRNVFMFLGMYIVLYTI